MNDFVIDKLKQCIVYLDDCIKAFEEQKQELEVLLSEQDVARKLDLAQFNMTKKK